MDRIVSACVGIEVAYGHGAGSGSGQLLMPLAFRAKLLMMTFSFRSPSIVHQKKNGEMCKKGLVSFPRLGQYSWVRFCVGGFCKFDSIFKCFLHMHFHCAFNLVVVGF